MNNPDFVYPNWTDPDYEYDPEDWEDSIIEGKLLKVYLTSSLADGLCEDHSSQNRNCGKIYR